MKHCISYQKGRYQDPDNQWTHCKSARPSRLCQASPIMRHKAKANSYLLTYLAREQTDLDSVQPASKAEDDGSSKQSCLSMLDSKLGLALAPRTALTTRT